MNSNEEISSLCDRIMAFCNRLNKRLDMIDDREQPGYQHYSHHQPLTAAAYGQPPYASFDSGVHNTGWPPPPTAPDPERHPEPYRHYPSLQYPASDYVTPWKTTAEPYFNNQPQPYFHNQLPPPKTHQPQPPPSPTTYQQPPLTSASTAASLLHQNHQRPPHNYPQLPYTYTDSYVQQYSSAGYHSWQHEYQPTQPPSQPLLPQSDLLLQPPQPQPPSCSHRRAATAPFPPAAAAAPNSTPTYTTSAISPAAIPQSRSCPEHPVVAAVPPPPQAAISSTCSPDRIDTLSSAPSPAPLSIVPPPRAVLSPPCSLKMINIAVQHTGKSPILDGEIESILPNQGTIGRIDSRNQPMFTGVDCLHDINMGQVKINLKDTSAFDPGGSTRAYDGSNSVVCDGENNMFDLFLNVEPQGATMGVKSFHNGSQRVYSDDVDMVVSSTTSMTSVLGLLLNLEFLSTADVRTLRQLCANLGQMHTFDPGGDISPRLLFATLLVVTWFPP